MKNKMLLKIFLCLLCCVVVVSLFLWVKVKEIKTSSVEEYLDNSRKHAYENNLQILADLVSIEVISYNEQYIFSGDEYLVVPFECINVDDYRNSNIIVNSPFDLYDQKYSYIVVARKFHKDADGNSVPFGFKYYVQVLDKGGYGTKLVDIYDVEIGKVNKKHLSSIYNETISIDNSTISELFGYDVTNIKANVLSY